MSHTPSPGGLLKARLPVLHSRWDHPWFASVFFSFFLSRFARLLDACNCDLHEQFTLSL